MARLSPLVRQVLELAADLMASGYPEPGAVIMEAVDRVDPDHLHEGLMRDAIFHVYCGDDHERKLQSILEALR